MVNLQALIDAASQTASGIVRLPAGVYPIEQPLRLDPDVRLIGCGVGRTVLQAVAPMRTLLDVSLAALRPVRGCVADLTLDGHQRAQFAARLCRIARFDWTRVHVREGVRANVFCEGIVFGRFTRVESVSSFIGFRFGSDSHPTNPEYCRLVTLDHCVIEANQYGIAAEEAAGLAFSRCDIEGNQIPFEFSQMCKTGEGIAFDMAGCWLERNAEPGRVHSACFPTTTRHRFTGTAFIDHDPAIDPGVCVERS